MATFNSLGGGGGSVGESGVGGSGAGGGFRGNGGPIRLNQYSCDMCTDDGHCYMCALYRSNPYGQFRYHPYGTPSNVVSSMFDNSPPQRRTSEFNTVGQQQEGTFTNSNSIGQQRAEEGGVGGILNWNTDGLLTGRANLNNETMAHQSDRSRPCMPVNFAYGVGRSSLTYYDLTNAMYNNSIFPIEILYNVLEALPIPTNDTDKTVRDALDIVTTIIRDNIECIVNRRMMLNIPEQMEPLNLHVECSGDAGTANLGRQRRVITSGHGPIPWAISQSAPVFGNCVKFPPGIVDMLITLFNQQRGNRSAAAPRSRNVRNRQSRPTPTTAATSGTIKKRKSRTCFTPYALEVLITYYNNNSHPSEERMHSAPINLSVSSTSQSNATAGTNRSTFMNQPLALRPIQPRIQSPIQFYIHPPIHPHVQSPYQPCIQSPMHPPIQSRIQSPIHPRIQIPMQPPIHPRIQFPMQPPIQAHIQSPMQPPIQPRIQSPMQPSIQSPTNDTSLQLYIKSTVQTWLDEQAQSSPRRQSRSSPRRQSRSVIRRPIQPAFQSHYQQPIQPAFQSHYQQPIQPAFQSHYQQPIQPHYQPPIQRTIQSPNIISNASRNMPQLLPITVVRPCSQRPCNICSQSDSDSHFVQMQQLGTPNPRANTPNVQSNTPNPRMSIPRANWSDERLPVLYQLIRKPSSTAQQHGGPDPLHQIAQLPSAGSAQQTVVRPNSESP